MTNPASVFTRRYLGYALALLALANFVNYMDRMILSVVLEEIKREFALSDTQIGLLAGFAFAIFFSTVGIFIARLADRYNRVRLIAISMLAWSVITALTGCVQNFWQLLLARIGVGVGEAGVSPAGQALVADYFKPSRRSAALAILTSGSTLGISAGLALGGWLGDLYGWRWAFIVAGVPGIPLSLLVWKTLIESPRGLSDGKVEALGPQVPFLDALRVLVARKTYVHIVIGGCFGNFIVFGMLQWMPALVIRKFELDMAQVGFFFGTAVGLGQAVGAVLGGFAADRLAKRDLRWLIRIPFIISFLYFPIYEVAIFASSSAVTFSVMFLISIVGGATYGPILAIMQSVVPPTLRATGAAFYTFVGGLIGFGGGPLVVGLMSDALTPFMDTAQALQLAMGIAVLASLGITFHMHQAMRFFVLDMKIHPRTEASTRAALS